LNGVKNTSGDMDESKLKEGSTDEFIKYLKDRNLLDDYLDDHQVFGDTYGIESRRRST